MLIKEETNLYDFIWKYYGTIDEILLPSYNLCQVGGVSCALPKNVDRFYPEASLENAFEIEVPAGKWISRPYSDSKRGDTFMCHTLISNVSVDFHRELGDAIGLAWSVDFIRNFSSYFTIYLHDARENVLLRTYAIDTLPNIILSRRSNPLEDDPNFDAMRFKAKAAIVPTLRRHPKSTKVHPCKESLRYSKNLCLIQHGWTERIKEMRAFHGENFTCFRQPFTLTRTLTKCPFVKKWRAPQTGSWA